MGTLIIIIQLILGFSILVILHEGGHYLPAKWFKTRVEKFYLFFNPGFSLFKKQIGETEWGIGWLPFGGYVKIAGMIDESFDKEQMKQPPQPWEFRSKPAWQRLIIMLGGVTVNFILGFFIYAMLLWGYGRQYIPADAVTQGIETDSLGETIGFKNGDKILKLGEDNFDEFDYRKFLTGLLGDKISSVKVERDGHQITLPLEASNLKAIVRNGVPPIFAPRRPFVLGGFPEDSPAEKAGFKAGDQITSLNGRPVPFFDQFADIADQYKGQEVQIGISRDGGSSTIPVTLSAQGKLGAYSQTFAGIYPDRLKREKYSLFRAFPAGVSKGLEQLGIQFSAFKQMINRNVSVKDNLGGPIAIANLYPRSWDWERFWEVTAFLSLILAFMNLLPIPALDGGHVMFLLGEVITGVKPSDKVMEITTTIGFFFLVALMLFIIGLDISRFF